MRSECDAIVVGAGHNGLTCACYLARAGLRVLVVELHPQIGGMTRSAELTLPGFVHDMHASGVQLGNLSPSIQELGLAERGFELLHPPINYVHMFPDGRVVEFWRDVAGTCRSMAKFSMRDAERWRQLMEEFEANRAQIVGGIFSPPTSEPAPIATLRSWLDQNFESEEVKCAFAVWGLHVSAAPDDAGGIAASAFGTVIQAVGNNPVRGGMQHLPDALGRVLEESGAETLCSARVVKILVEGGRARGVRLADGTEHRARQLVAVSVNPILVARDMLTEEELGARVAEKVRRLKHGHGQMTIWLALAEPVEFRAGAYFERTLYVHATLPRVDALQSVSDEAQAGVLPADPMMLFVNEGGIDPTRVPTGRASMRIFAQPLPYDIRKNAVPAVSGAAWEDVRESYADYVIDQAEQRYVPGLRKKILKRVVHDPVSMSRESPDCVRGDVCHVGVVPDQSGSMRPVPEMGRYRTPIPGLYLCGSGTHPGPSVSLACGHNAAKVILADLAHGTT